MTSETRLINNIKQETSSREIRWEEHSASIAKQEYEFHAKIGTGITYGGQAFLLRLFYWPARIQKYLLILECGKESCEIEHRDLKGLVNKVIKDLRDRQPVWTRMPELYPREARERRRKMVKELHKLFERIAICRLLEEEDLAVPASSY